MDTRDRNEKLYPDAGHLAASYFHLSLPVVLGSVVTIVYNLADTYFIAQTQNTLLVASVSLCAPVFMILMALGNIFGQGGSSLISRLLGKRDDASVARVSAFCFYIALASGAAAGAVILLLRDAFLGLLGASPDTLPHARDYCTVLLMGAPLIAVNFIHMNLLRCEGMSGASMLGTAVGAAVNVVLDPVMIPGMGAAGAALATVIGYACSDAFLLAVVLRRSRCLSVRPCWRISGAFLRDILSIGVTAALTNIAASLCVILLNQQLLRFGDEKIAAMGIVQKVTMITQMILVGFSFGGIPLFGFLTGAGEREKVRKLLRFCLLFVTAAALVMTGVVFLTAGPLLGAITPDAQLVAGGIPMLRCQTAGSAFAGVVMLITCLCQASGKAVPALILSLSRQGLVFAAVLLVGAVVAGYKGILAAQCISDVLSAGIAAWIYAACWGRTQKA